MASEQVDFSNHEYVSLHSSQLNQMFYVGVRGHFAHIEALHMHMLLCVVKIVHKLTSSDGRWMYYVFIQHYQHLIQCLKPVIRPGPVVQAKDVIS